METHRFEKALHGRWVRVLCAKFLQSACRWNAVGWMLGVPPVDEERDEALGDDLGWVCEPPR
jgi:hypothetical protein